MGETQEKLSSVLILNKKDIMETLNYIYKYCKNDKTTYNDENSIFFTELNKELEIFISKVKEADFPEKMPFPWSYYIELNMQFFEIGIGVLDDHILLLKNNENKPVLIDDIFNNKNFDDVTRGVILYSKYSLLKHNIKRLTAEEYASNHGLSPISVRQYIREGLIAGARKIGRQWIIPILARKRSSEENYVAVYRMEYDKLLNIPLKYKYLDDKNISSVIIFRHKDLAKKRFTDCKLTLEYNDHGHNDIRMSFQESKEVELYLQSELAFIYDSYYDYRLFIWEKLRIQNSNLASWLYSQEISYDPLLLK